MAKKEWALKRTGRFWRILKPNFINLNTFNYYMSSSDKFETYKNVFDDKTIEVLEKLSSQGYFDELKSPISIGKEANVFSALTKDKTYVCVKIYRVNTADFKRMYKYIAGDTRFQGLQKKRRPIIKAWAQREYRNLLIAREAGVTVPTPYAVRDNVLIIEFIGTKAGQAAPRLKDKPPENPKKFAQLLTKDIQKLTKAGLLHGDLSEFNILNNKEKPVVIDLSHGFKIDSQHSRDLLERDIQNVKRYFSKYKVEININNA